jgi:MFS transporter, DHA1 family, multidrug resistance protein
MIGKFQTQLSELQPWQRNLWVIFVAQLCTAVGFSMIFPFLPLYVADLGTNTALSIEFWAGMVFSAQAAVMMITAPIWGALADRYGRKIMVERAMFGGALVVLLMAFARSAEELVLLRMIQGAVTGTVSAANALVAASAPRNRTGFAMGVVQVGLWGGVAIGPLIGGILADVFGFRVPFIITAVLLTVSGIVVVLAVREEFTPEARAANKKKSFFREWRNIFSMPGVLPTYFVRFLTGLSRMMMVPIMPLFVAALLATGRMTLPVPPGFFDVFGGQVGVSTYTGLVIGIASGTATISGVYLGRLGDRIGHRRILMGSALAATCLFIPQAFVTHAWQLLVLQGLSGLAIGGLVASPSALLARYTLPGEEGAVYGLDNSVVAAARGIAPLIGAGVAFWFGLRVTLIASGGLFLVIVLAALLLLPQKELAAQQEDTPTETGDKEIPQGSIQLTRSKASAGD